MKRVFIVMILIMSLILPCNAKSKKNSEAIIDLPNVFITDTTEAEEYTAPENFVLKGYAEYMEDSDTIHLTDEDGQFVLNLKVPQKITSKKLVINNTQLQSKQPVMYSKYEGEEYKVIPQSGDSTVSAGGLSFGTTYDNEVSYSEFEQTTGLFTRYDIGKFGVKTSYKRTIGSTFGNYIDNVYVSPEIRINKIVSIKEVLSANMTYRRKKAELVLSINPLANTKEDRLNFEFGAAQTYDEDNNLIRSKFRFDTKFKL